MFFKLLALFTIVPLIELALLIPLGMHIGLWPTIGLVVGTALLGAFLGKLEGKRAWNRILTELNSGQLPADALLDGLAILIAGIFLITPGVLTDVVAILLLIPVFRAPVRAIAKKRFAKMLESGEVSFFGSASFGGSLFDGPVDSPGGFHHSPLHQSADRGVIDVTPEDEPPA